MPARLNRSTNPSPEVSTAGWATGSAGTVGTVTLTRVADTTPAGAFAFELNATALAVGSGNIAVGYIDLPAVPGQLHALQAQLRWVAGSVPAGATARVRLSYRAGGGLASYDSATVPTTQLTYTPRSVVAGAVAPATTTTIRAEVQIVGGSSAGAATVRFDATMPELAATVGTYFDGDTVDDATWRYDWTGTAGLSTSTATPWIDATLVASGDPNPVQLVITGIPNGVDYEVVGTAADGSAWPVPGGVGTSDGGQVVLVDNRGALNTPTTYVATWSGVAHTSLPITVPYTKGYVLQSLDGRTVVPFVWRDNGIPREYVIRATTFDVPGRRRPPVRYASGGDGGGTLEIRTTPTGTAALVDALHAGRPLVLRTDGAMRDLPAVDLLLITRAANRSWGAITAPNAAPSPDRVWDLQYTLVNDPEPSVALSAWTWDDFDDATLTWDEFDALALTWDQFDTYPWGQLS
jgi:hypothetical protein